ncbi:MAG TPA: outer membrane beta-barrel domain-containing protein [Gammaproteobacteria bacterium]|nr:outer membrane beta-barrel domain-containing protein [Gammaproteobacteria bacterium]
MANWFCSVLLKRVLLVFVSSFILLSPLAQAAEEMHSDEKPVIEPEIYRRPLDESKIDSENFEITAFSGLMSVEDFGVNTLIGVRLAFHVSESIFFEASLGQVKTSKTSYERLSGSVELLTDEQRVLNYYDLSVGYNLLPGEAFLSRRLAFNTAFYLIAGIGSTRFAGDDRYTINYGFGYSFLATDWLGLHADVRNHVFDMELLGNKMLTNNLEMSMGLSIFF